MSRPVKIIAILKARPGKTGALRTLLEGMLEPSRKEPGNLRWDIWQEPENPDCFVLDELYADNAAVATHRETSHFKHYLSRIHDLAERSAYVLSASDVA